MRKIPIIIIVYTLIFTCKAELNNPADPSSESFLQTLILQYFLTGRTAPTFSLQSGYHNSPNLISILYPVVGSEIFYTTDGSDPNPQSRKFTEPFHIWQIAGAEIKAIARNPNGSLSGISQATYSYSNIKTNQSLCWDQVGNPIGCAGTGQDGEIQAGAERNYINPHTNPQFPSDYITVDNYSGLTWRSCYQEQSGSDCTGGSTIFMNGNDAMSGTNGCLSLNSNNNGQGFAGRRDWRLPEMEELRTIFDMNSSNVVNSLAFPNASSQGSISNTRRIYNSGEILGIFDLGITYYDINNNFRVRCVAGARHERKYRFLDLENQTVRDLKTGLIWQKCLGGQIGNTCDGFATNGGQFNDSLNYCNSLGLNGMQWRLPNAHEIYGLLNIETEISETYISSQYFPNNSILSYRSSTSIPNYTNIAYTTVATDLSDTVDKIDSASARCVTGP